MGESGAKDEFKLENVSSEFVSCFEGEHVRMDKYIDGYRELIRFFSIMGTIFSFVTSDVHSKIGILLQHLSSDAGDHYVTVEKMIEYELTNRITERKARSSEQPSGCRTLLRLHRALAFLILLFRELASNSTDSFSSVVGRSYNATLASHHPWVVRSAVSVALYAVPSRSNLVQRLDPEGSEQRVVHGLNAAVLAMQPVYDKVQSLYADNNLLQLP